jgi:hypothetical protein
LNALYSAAAQRNYDRALPSDNIIVRELDVEEITLPRFTAASVTEADVEQFIAELVAAPNKQIFFENRLGLAARDYKLQIAVAQLWGHDVNAVHPAIGQVFWSWARNCAIEAAA